MTRFARAKGSKASNERVPESATPWNQMKKDLKNSQNEAKNKGAREKMNKLRQETYDEFIDEEQKKIGKKWAEFPKKKQPKQKKTTKKVTEQDVTNEMIDDFIKSDEELDESLKNDIEQALKQQSPKKRKQKTNVPDDDDDDDEAPEEQTSKVPPKQAKTKKQQKRKVAKTNETEPKRRKPDLVDQSTITVNGETQKISRFDGFLVLQSDHERLQELRKSLIKKGVPQSEVKRTIQTERRKAEKHLSRLKKQVCFNCRKAGHVLSECPDLGNKNGALVDHSGTGICFKCGSTEHKLNECKAKEGQGLKYASCFICREQGHLARECPDNPRGLYPQGGACRQCGDVTHLKKDCPQNAQSKSEKNISLNTISEGDIEALDEGDEVAKKTTKKQKKSTKKIVKF